MTIKEIVQKRYELEINSLSSQAKNIISTNFSDFSRLMVFHSHGPYVFNSYTSSEKVKQELFDFSNRLFDIYVKEQIEEWKRIAIEDLSSPSIITERVFDNFLQKAYLLILQTEEKFVQTTIKNNCSHYTQALCFIKREKSIDDFLRYSKSEKKDIDTFFNKFGDIYDEIITIYNQKKKELENKSESSEPSLLFVERPKTNSNTLEPPKEKTKEKGIIKTQPKKKKSSSKTKHVVKSERLPENNEEEIIETHTGLKMYVYGQQQTNSIIVSQPPGFYDTPHICFDDLTMMACINYGCNGKMSFGLSADYLEPSIPILYNFERDHVKYDPDEIYRKPIVSDRITRSAHYYKWFGANGLDHITSLKKYGIAAKCTNLYFGEYRCYVPVEIDDYDGEGLAEIETSDDIIVSALTNRKDLKLFLEFKNISLRDFKLLEITDKLCCLCDYYDIYDFLGLDEDLYEKNDIILELQAAMSKKTIDEFLWDSYTLEAKNDFLTQRLKALRNKEAYLRFNIVRINYLPYSKEMELSYLIHSEYSIEVYVDIDIIYKDGSSASFSHIKVDSYDDQFIYFQGKTRIKSEKDYINIQLIRLTCSDE